MTADVSGYLRARDLYPPLLLKVRRSAGTREIPLCPDSCHHNTNTSLPWRRLMARPRIQVSHELSCAMSHFSLFFVMLQPEDPRYNCCSSSSSLSLILVLTLPIPRSSFFKSCYNLSFSLTIPLFISLSSCLTPSLSFFLNAVLSTVCQQELVPTLFWFSSCHWRKSCCCFSRRS